MIKLLDGENDNVNDFRSPEIILFGGANGIKYDKKREEIEEMFEKTLEIVKSHSNVILDTADQPWMNHMANFRYEIVKLEGLVKDLIIEVFNDVWNVEEGIEAINAFQKFKKQESIGVLLTEKWFEVTKIAKYLNKCM